MIYLSFIFTVAIAVVVLAVYRMVKNVQARMFDIEDKLGIIDPIRKEILDSLDK